jgi:hypothetical protein
MDGIPISEDQALSIDDIAEGVRGLRIVFVNVFAITHADGSWSLIDAALPSQRIAYSQLGGEAF